MKAVILKAHSETGIPKVTDFSIEERPIPKLQTEKDLLVKTLYLSMDPFLRTRMNPALPSYLPHYEVGKPISGLVVGQVVERKEGATGGEKFGVGKLVSGYGEFSEYVLMNEYSPLLLPVDLPLEDASHALGVVGLSGVTGWFGLEDVCQPKEGETIIVSGAGGAIGSYVGQLAKIKNCTVIGLTSSDDKKRQIMEELGFDACINHTQHPHDLTQTILSLAPRGVDMYFDVVGGDITDSVLSTMNVGGRVCVCGVIAREEDGKTVDVGQRQWSTILSRGLTVRGFRVIREFEAKFLDGLAQMKLLFSSSSPQQHKLVAKQTIHVGIETVPQAFVSLFYPKEGMGKQIVKL